MMVAHDSMLMKSLYHRYTQYLKVFAKPISEIDLIIDNIWDYLCCANHESMFKDNLKLYYEVKLHNRWDTSIKSKNVSYDTFMKGFICCAFDKYTSKSSSFVPSTRNDVYYFNDYISQSQFIHSALRFGFVLILSMINEIEDVLMRQRMCSDYNESFYHINYYNKNCALDHYFNNLFCNMPLLLTQ